MELEDPILKAISMLVTALWLELIVLEALTLSCSYYNGKYDQHFALKILKVRKYLLPFGCVTKNELFK